MSRPVPSARALQALRTQLSLEPYRCSYCQSFTARKPATGRRVIHRTSYRSASTVVAPVTSVNASRNVPEGNQELHNALSSLEQNAISYVNFSQLSLALRGLELKDPVTRIAFRQSGTSGDSRRLVRLLLADPLAEEQDWESRIRETDGDARSLLITYGDTTDYDTSNSLLRILSIPSAVLQKNRIELVLLNPNAADEALQGGVVVPEEALVTKVETPISSTGRYSQVTYPVHKAVTIGSGLRGIRNTPTLGVGSEENDLEQLLASAIDVPWENPEQTLADQGLLVVSLSQAEKALAEIRKSSSLSTAYEHDWLGSKVSDINSFILDGTLPSIKVKPSHRAFISSIIASAADAVEADEAKAASKRVSPDELAGAISTLDTALTTWSETAHTELRDELANAFASRTWRKLAWYKLPFRVDDVTMIGSDIIGRYYLVDAEKGMIWLAGRIQQAGLATTDYLSGAEDFASSDNSSLQAPDSKVGPSRETPLSYFVPNTRWPQQIASSRNQLLTLLLPTLQARAQSLVLQAFSGSAFATAVGGLAYTMVSTTGIYEAGSVAAFGVALSLQRLQNKWGKAKDAFVKDVQEEGRLVLEEAEQGCRGIIRASRVPNVDETQEDRDKAREAIERAQAVLETVD